MPKSSALIRSWLETENRKRVEERRAGHARSKMGPLYRGAHQKFVATDKDDTDWYDGIVILKLRLRGGDRHEEA